MKVDARLRVLPKCKVGSISSFFQMRGPLVIRFGGLLAGLFHGRVHGYFWQIHGRFVFHPIDQPLDQALKLFGLDDTLHEVERVCIQDEVNSLLYRGCLVQPYQLHFVQVKLAGRGCKIL